MTLRDIRQEGSQTPAHVPMYQDESANDAPKRARFTVKRISKTQDELQTASEAIRVVGDRLKAYAHRYDTQQDTRAIFAYAYAEITEAIGQALRDNSFQAPIWVARLDAAFAQYYFDALEAYDNQKPVSAAWERAFSLICHSTPSPSVWTQPSVLEALVVSLVAHIVYDLPCALADVMADDGLKPEHMADFNKINDILGDQIDALQDKISDRYDPSLKWFDRWIGESYDELLTGYTVKLSRGLAWFNALRLLVVSNGCDDEKLKQSILDTTIKGINLVSRPTNRWLGVGLCIYRLFSRFFRRWPTQPIHCHDWVMA